MPQLDRPRRRAPRNRKLEAARRAVASPSGAPGMCMSRRELAEAANAYVWEHTAGRQRTNMTEHDIGRYERGEVHWPGDWRLFGLRGVLGVDSDSELGFFPNRKTSTSSVITADRPQPPDVNPERHTNTDTTVTAGPPRGILTGGGQEPAITRRTPGREVEKTNRRRALATWLGTAAGLSLLDLGDRRAVDAAGTGLVDRRLVAGHVEVAEALAGLYRSVDPRAALAVAATYADELLSLYDRGRGSGVDALGVVVVGVHCQVGLWACHAHRPGARRYLATACDVAAGLGDRALQARTLGALAYLHSSAPRGGLGGDPRRALELLGQAFALAANADGFTRGWLAIWRADQRATLGDLAAARADLDLADATLDTDNGPDHGFFCRHHYGYGMHGHLDSVRGLVHALAAELDESERTFTNVQAHAANGRRRIASWGHQALAYVRASQPQAACEALSRSLSLIDTEPYAMGLQRVLGVRGSFDPAWADLPPVRDLDRRLATLTPAGAGLR